MYHNDQTRLFYNTGNVANSAKRCGAACIEHEDADAYSESSLFKRFKLLKKRATKVRSLQKTIPLANRTRVNRDILTESEFFNENAVFEESESGMIHCRGLINAQLTAKLAESALFEFTTMDGARNNESNIGRDINVKLSDWRSNYEHEKLAQHELRGLRWVTLGCHHNWLETVPGDKATSGPVPSILTDLGVQLARLLCFDETSFSTDASIINFYPASKTSIGIHRDDAEYQVAPIITISLGCPGIFILGRGERGDDCHEILLEHGDVCVLEGADRGALHAVPRILSEQECEEGGFDFNVPLATDPTSSYLRQSRINISLRQITQ